MKTYSNRNEALQTEIIAPIEASGGVKDAYAEFDIDAIEDEVLGGYEDGYAVKVDVNEFWQIVEKHAR